ncbi:polymorphic toxin type 44 domain-containing protein [Streptomyces sp. NPDC020898]|uniref:polymorphic toxin type 44 domain-containing protein n=1 Tax=Streptomyces sp. NPDC020898 TaxID=3365101 RepID=UPI0037B9911B
MRLSGQIGGEWDRKGELVECFHLESSDFRTDILGNGHGGKILFDVWSNIHYDYVGRAAGFGKGELVAASHAGGEAVGKSGSGGGDDISINVGMDLHRAIVDAVPEWQGVAGGGDPWEYKVIP